MAVYQTMPHVSEDHNNNLLNIYTLFIETFISIYYGDLELFSQYTAVFHVIMYLHFYVDYMFQPIYLGHHQVLLVCYFVTLT